MQNRASFQRGNREPSSGDGSKRLTSTLDTKGLVSMMRKCIMRSVAEDRRRYTARSRESWAGSLDLVRDGDDRGAGSQSRQSPTSERRRPIAPENARRHAEWLMTTRWSPGYGRGDRPRRTAVGSMTRPARVTSVVRSAPPDAVFLPTRPGCRVAVRRLSSDVCRLRRADRGPRDSRARCNRREVRSP